MIDLNNTWCETTEENVKKLISLGFSNDTYRKGYASNRITIFPKGENQSCNSYIYDGGGAEKQIHLVNGEFEYVTDTNVGENKNNDINVLTKLAKSAPIKLNDKHTEEECQFKKYGFEVPEFECEILKEVNGNLIGYVMSEHKKTGHFYPYAFTWDKLGFCFDNEDNQLFRYKLTPLKKPWYEDESNFPKHIIDSLDNIVIVSKFDGKFFSVWNGFKMELNLYKRLATKEEVLQLIKKEK